MIAILDARRLKTLDDIRALRTFPIQI